MGDLAERLTDAAQSVVKGMEDADRVMGAMGHRSHIEGMSHMAVLVHESGDYGFCSNLDAGEAIEVLKKILEQLQGSQN